MFEKEYDKKERKRIQELHSYQVLDTFPEKDFDDITNLAADLCNAPISLISLVDEDRQWFKSNHGLGIRQTPRNISFCGQAIKTPKQPFEITNALTEERFKNSPLVSGEPFIIYYYGVPLISPSGYALGTLCIIDHKERHLTARQKMAVEVLAKQVVNLLELRIKNTKIRELMGNMFPVSKLREIEKVGTIYPMRYENCTVIFTDFRGFTSFCSRRTAKEVVKELHYLYSNFDSIMYFNNVEKIKTIGDAYMACAGIDTESANPAIDAINAAKEMIAFIDQYKQERIKKKKDFLDLRIGINSGSVFSGVVGIKKYSFDIWGNTVNIAAHLENKGEVGKINISQTTYDLIKKDFSCTYRGAIAIKTAEEIPMYFVDHKKATNDGF